MQEPKLEHRLTSFNYPQDTKLSKIDTNRESPIISTQNNSLSFRAFVIGTILLLSISWVQELWRFPFNHDNGFILDTSRRLLAGEKLYTDIPEVNPPLIYLIGSGIALISQMSGIHEILVWRFCFLLAITLVILFTVHLLKGNGWELENEKCQSFIWILIALCFCYSGYDFSQREHIAAVFFLPYIAVCEGRALGRPAQGKKALLSGLIAGFAFSLKPFFLLVFCLVEIYMWTVLRKIGRPWVRLENITFAAFSGGFLIWVIFGTPYIEFIRFIQPYYASYNMPISQIVNNRSLFPFILAFFLNFACKAPNDKPHLRQLLFLTAAGFTLSYVVQMKGFSYHGLPARIFSWLLVSLIILDLSSAVNRQKTILYNIARKLSANLYIFPILYSVLLSVFATNYHGGLVVQNFMNQIHELGREKRIQLLTFSVFPAFPAFNYYNFQTTQRGSATILAKLYQGKDTFRGPFPYQKGSENWHLQQTYIDTTVEDIAIRKPDFIFSDDNLFRQALGKSRFNFIEFLLLDDRFKLLFKNYHFLKEASGFKIFKRNTESFYKK